MSAALVLVLALQAAQQASLAATATVDRRQLAVGELLTLTIRVESRGNGPVDIGEPTLAGLERRGFREQSQVSIQGGVATRVTTRQIQLLAERAGTGAIGVVRVRQGDLVVETSGVSVAIDARHGEAGESGLSPRARTLLAQMPPPRGIENVALGILVVPGAAAVGSQLDLLVAAWFPRETRLQLRTPPTITRPEVRGAWVYPQPAVSGIAASRQIGGRWYDLFVQHDLIFPLTPGTLTLGRARVTYALPITYSFLTRELQHEVQSQEVHVPVADLPAAGRPPAFSGMAAGGLTLRVDAQPRSVSRGEASTVSVTLAGRGNVALWPEPEISWPHDVRVYPTGYDQTLRLDGGPLAGTKRFSYLLVPDSAGVHTIPRVRLSYFDLDARRYSSVVAAPVELVAGETERAVALRPTPPALRDAGSARWLARPVPAGWIWAVGLLGPLLVLSGGLRSRVRRWRRRAPARGPEPLDLTQRRFRRVLERLVPAAAQREGDQLNDALRAAGIDPAVAAHAARLRDRLRHAVYGPGGVSDPEELGAEVNEVLRALIGEGQAA